MNINEILKGEFNLKNEQIENVIKLIDEGNTIPFIARYRKEMTGEMSDIILRQFNDRLNYLRNLQSRKEDVQRIIGEQGKLTDEIIKNLRANVHEFKNSLYVILGLLEINAYDDAKKYILKIQKIQENTISKFSSIEDKYVRGLLISRESVAKERKIDFVLTQESFLEENHGIIDSNDIVTILGNLIENAFEACSLCGDIKKRVEVSLYEDESVIEIQVRDNGRNIDEKIRNTLFLEGISSKGDGRGTGLYLVKNRVEIYNGSIDIEEFDDEKIFVITILKGVDK